MIRDFVLRRSSDELADYIEKNIKLAGSEKREEVMELFDRLYLFFPEWAILTCPVMHTELSYVSPNSPSVFGYSKEFLINNRTIQKFFSLVHENDQKDLYDCFSFYHNYIKSIPPAEHHIYRAIFYYRFRKPGGQYMQLHDEKAALRLEGSGNFYYGLFRDISDRPFKGVYFEIYRQEDMLRKIETFKPSSARQLSKREQELVTLMKQGLSTKEIAWNLNISHHTVRNIKSKLFEKYNVNNSIELLNMTC